MAGPLMDFRGGAKITRVCKNSVRNALPVADSEEKIVAGATQLGCGRSMQRSGKRASMFNRLTALIHKSAHRTQATAMRRNLVSSLFGGDEWYRLEAQLKRQKQRTYRLIAMRDAIERTHGMR